MKQSSITHKSSALYHTLPNTQPLMKPKKYIHVQVKSAKNMTQKWMVTLALQKVPWNFWIKV